jgi:hypothetical protein
MAVCFAFKIAIPISSSKNTVYFLLLLMSSLQQNWRTELVLPGSEEGRGRSKVWGGMGEKCPKQCMHI